MWGAWQFWKSSLSGTRTSDKPEQRTELRPQTSRFGGSGRHALQHASLLARHPLEKHPMPNARTANAVRLEFAPDSLVQSNLSGAAFTGDWLWVAGDEACGLDRLRLLDPVGREVLRLGEVRDFPLADLLDLPGCCSSMWVWSRSSSASWASSCWGPIS